MGDNTTALVVAQDLVREYRMGDQTVRALDGLDLTRAPLVRPVPTEGSNVEFVRPLGPGHLAMRVYERGVGETRSCGTGVCAAALAMGFWSGSHDESTTWRVDVPGGSLTVRSLPGREVELAGPAVLVADGVPIELGEDALHVLLHGALRDDEALRDASVRQTLGDE